MEADRKQIRHRCNKECQFVLKLSKLIKLSNPGFIDALTALLKLNGLPTSKNAEWIGIITPCITLFSLKKYRLEKLRMGYKVPETSKTSSDISNTT